MHIKCNTLHDAHCTRRTGNRVDWDVFEAIDKRDIFDGLRGANCLTEQVDSKKAAAINGR